MNLYTEKENGDERVILVILVTYFLAMRLAN